MEYVTLCKLWSGKVHSFLQRRVWKWELLPITYVVLLGRLGGRFGAIFLPFGYAGLPAEGMSDIATKPALREGVKVPKLGDVIPVTLPK